MREETFTDRLLATAAGAAVFVLVAGCSVEAGGENAAHSLAEKFAREAAKVESDARRRADEAKRKVDARHLQTERDRRAAEEAEMLARARAEAEQRRADMLKARAEAERQDRLRRDDEERRLAQARKAEEARKAEAVRADAEKAEEDRRVAARRAEEAARTAEALRRAEEDRLLAEAQRAEEARRAAEVAARAQERRKAEEELRKAEAERNAEEERRLAEAQRTEQVRIAAEAERRAEEARRLGEARERQEAERVAEDARRRVEMEAEREREAIRLTEALRKAREQKEARAAQDATRVGAVDAPSPEKEAATRVAYPVHRLNSGQAVPDVEEAADLTGRVTVLLLMQPGDRGIRRRNKTADPVLCGYEDCYISNGPYSAASLLPARRALGFFRTWGRRAGACNNSLGCVFRDVDLDELDHVLRPVDMRVVRHDRREIQEIETASRCSIERGRLACSDGIQADDYLMWIVPERLAAMAGAAMLARALEDGLAVSERTALGPSRIR